MSELKIHSDKAWEIASHWSDVLASDTRTLAAAIDVALQEARRHALTAFADRMFNLHGFMLMEPHQGKHAVTITFPDLTETQQFHGALVELSQHRSSLTESKNAPTEHGPSYLDFITPDEVFDKGPAAVEEWQKAYGSKPQTPPPSTHVEVKAEAFDRIVAARKAHIEATNAYNARLLIVRKERERGTWDLNTDHEYREMNETARAVDRLVRELADAAIATTEGSDNGQ